MTTAENIATWLKELEEVHKKMEDLQCQLLAEQVEAEFLRQQIEEAFKDEVLARHLKKNPYSPEF